MSNLYVGEGDILIPTPFGTALPPSIIHATNGRGEYVECDRAHWWHEWRVVDARPGGIHWPIFKPKNRGKSRGK